MQISHIHRPDTSAAVTTGSGNLTAGSAAIRRFGAQIDVRKRGALRLNASARSATAQQEQPAVVRMWNGENCRELTAHQARALAAQLAAAALYADEQNSG